MTLIYRDHFQDGNSPTFNLQFICCYEQRTFWLVLKYEFLTLTAIRTLTGPFPFLNQVNAPSHCLKFLEVMALKLLFSQPPIIPTSLIWVLHNEQNNHDILGHRDFNHVGR